MAWAVGLFPGSFPDVADPTDADAGRTDVSVDPARRNVRTPGGRPLTATATATSDTPAVASNGDLDVRRRTLAPVLVRWVDAAPCVLRATANWNRSSQLTVAAALTMRSSTSPNKSLRLSALTLSAHYLNTANTCGGYTHGS